MDYGHGGDFLSVGARVPVEDSCRAYTKWSIRRYDVSTWDDVLRLGAQPYSETEVIGNVITNAGWTRLMSLATATGSTQALTATAVRIGVGNGSDEEDYGDTDLQGASKWFEPVQGAATLGTRTMAFTAAFDGSVANFDWNEFGIDVGTPTVSAGATVNSLLFNRKAPVNQGTKASGQTWTATATVTFS